MAHAVRRSLSVASALLAVALAPPTLRAQDAPPTAPPAPPAASTDEGWQHLHTWEADAITVTGEAPPELHEEQLIGPYRQPRWTADRRFAETRVYVIPEGKVEGEYWMRTDDNQHADNEYQHMYEVEVGLPHRMQFDFYAVADHVDANQPFAINQQQYELRYALADWGQLWGNPTLYFELINRTDQPDKVETKVLLGDEAAPGWHWGTNVACEQEVSGGRERELEVTAGLSKTIVDEKLSLGGEVKVSRITEHGSGDGNPHDEYLVGPSLQWRPVPRCHVDFTPLVGVGADSPRAQIFLIVGWEF